MMRDSGYNLFLNLVGSLRQAQKDFQGSPTQANRMRKSALENEVDRILESQNPAMMNNIRREYADARYL